MTLTCSQGCQTAQQPADVAVIMPTILRPSLKRAVESVYNQRGVDSIQLLIGIDKPWGDISLIEWAQQAVPPHVTLTVVDLGYSTGRINGGIYTVMSGALRTILSYAANSRYVAFLDDDNWYRQDHLASLLHAIRGYQWAFSLRQWVDDQGKPFGVDLQESVGPGAGCFAETNGGFVDGNCILLDKIACESVLPLWCKSPDQSGRGVDRVVFQSLSNRFCFGFSQRASVGYQIDANDSMHSFRLQALAMSSDWQSQLHPNARFELTHLAPMQRRSLFLAAWHQFPAASKGVIIGLLPSQPLEHLLRIVRPLQLHLILSPDQELPIPLKDKEGVVLLHNDPLAEELPFESDSLNWVVMHGSWPQNHMIHLLNNIMPKVKSGGMVAGFAQEKPGWDCQEIIDWVNYVGSTRVELTRCTGDHFVIEKLKSPSNDFLTTASLQFMRDQGAFLRLTGKPPFHASQRILQNDFQFQVQTSFLPAALDRRHTTPYCYIHPLKQILAVVTPDILATTRYDTLRQGQFEQANSLVMIPIDQLVHCVDDSLLQEVQLIFTLAGNGVELPSVQVMLPSAEFFRQIGQLRCQEKHANGEILLLLKHMLLLLLQPFFLAGYRTMLLQLPAEGQGLADWLAQIAPTARWLPPPPDGRG